MNCQDARESLSILLDGDLSLSERVPLEIHVNTCGECRQMLADLQIQKVVEQQPAPGTANQWRPTLASWRPMLLFARAFWLSLLASLRPALASTRASWRSTLASLRPALASTRASWQSLLDSWRPRLEQWRLTIAQRRPSLAQWRPSLAQRRPTMAQWRPTLAQWQSTFAQRWSTLAQRRPTFAHWRPTVPHWRATLTHWRPGRAHWRPTLAGGFVGKALGAIRTDDAASRLRRFVEKFPPRHLAMAAAVPIVVTLAIFVFERGFAVGTATRQRPSPPSTVMRDTPAPEMSPAPVSPAPRASAPRPVPPAQSTSSQTPAVRPQPLPPKLPPPMDKAKAIETKVAQKLPETKSINGQSAPRSPKTENGVGQMRTEAAAPAKPAPAKAPPVPPRSTVGEAARKENPAAPRMLAQGTTHSAADAVAAAAAGRKGTVDVVGRLQVKSRSEAERDLAALLARAGGKSVNRQRGPAFTVVEAAVPQANYGKFTQGLVRLGAWRLEAERSPLPDLVQVSVRLAD